MPGETSGGGPLDPDLRQGRFAFVSVAEIPAGVEPVASIAEAEGMTLVLDAGVAETRGFSYEFVAAMITLRIDSALGDVGLTASVSSALAEAGIACNVIAGYHHDHLFVPYDRAQEAIEVLRRVESPASIADSEH